jgi:cytochrome c553
MLRTLAFLAGLAVSLCAWSQDEAVPAFKSIDSVEARVQGCVTCHGQSGQGTENGYFPRIAGKPAAYLYNQLIAFRDGTRKYPPMNYLVAYLPDPYLKEMAQHFASLRPAFAAKEQPNVDAAVVERGKAIATTGDPSRGIPPCIACHGAGLTAWNPASRVSSDCAPPTSPRSSRAGAWAIAAPPIPIA